MVGGSSPSAGINYINNINEARLSADSIASRMDRDARVRACYQHCALKWVMSERMTNQSLRERFHLEEGKAAVASQVIAATIGAGLIKPDESVGGSRKFARYLPFWA